MARRRGRADGALDAPDQRRVQRHALAQHDEHRHIAFAPQKLKIDHQTVEHFGQRLDHAVDVARAHAHAVAVDGGVAAAVDDCAAARCDAKPVAMPPDAGVHVEITVQIAPVAGVVPEVEGHGRHGRGADQLTHLVHDRLALLVEGLDARPEAAPLHFSHDNGQGRHAADEGPGEVGAAGDRVDPDIAPDMLGNPLVAFRGQWRAGRTHGAQRPQRAHLARLDTGFLAGRIKRRTGTQKRHADFPSETPQRGVVGPGRVAVVQAGRRPHQQTAHLAVPHDPAGGGKPVEAVFGTEVVVQAHQLDLLQHDAAMAVHDGFGQAGGAR